MESPWRNDAKFQEEICVVVNRGGKAIIVTEDDIAVASKQLLLMAKGTQFQVGVYHLVSVHTMEKALESKEPCDA